MESGDGRLGKKKKLPCPEQDPKRTAGQAATERATMPAGSACSACSATRFFASALVMNSRCVTVTRRTGQRGWLGGLAARVVPMGNRGCPRPRIEAAWRPRVNFKHEFKRFHRARPRPSHHSLYSPPDQPLVPNRPPAARGLSTFKNAAPFLARDATLASPPNLSGLGVCAMPWPCLLACRDLPDDLPAVSADLPVCLYPYGVRSSPLPFFLIISPALLCPDHSSVCPLVIRLLGTGIGIGMAWHDPATAGQLTVSERHRPSVAKAWERTTSGGRRGSDRGRGGEAWPSLAQYERVSGSTGNAAYCCPRAPVAQCHRHDWHGRGV
ncbi:hypothetical protein F4780DRAFT_45711 [Xylariomycetidae sp. FL0641]|nr:hypothetical protein F4780DRAFT_45711 [Xylariomycetidae sp. FL0641]